MHLRGGPLYSVTAAGHPHHCGGTLCQPWQIRICQSCSALNRSIRRLWRTWARPSLVMSESVTSTHLAHRDSPAAAIQTTFSFSGDRSQPSVLAFAAN
jgi:hypothetical protein